MASGTIASEEDTQEHSYVNTTKEYYHPLAWQTQHDRQYRTDWCTFRRRWELFEVSYRLNKRLQEERWQPFSSVCQQTFVRLGVRKITMRRRQRQERHDIGSSAYLLLQQEKRHLWPVQFHSKSPETRWVVRWLWSMIAICSTVCACHYEPMQDELLPGKVVHRIRDNDVHRDCYRRRTWPWYVPHQSAQPQSLLQHKPLEKGCKENRACAVAS